MVYFRWCHSVRKIFEKTKCIYRKKNGNALFPMQSVAGIFEKLKYIYFIKTMKMPYFRYSCLRLTIY